MPERQPSPAFPLLAPSSIGPRLLPATRRSVRYDITVSVRAFRVAFALHLALVTSIAVAAYTGHVHLPASLPQIDKVGHALFFGLLGALAHGALAFRRVKGIPLGPLLVLLAAGIEELCQGLSPHRTMSIFDYAADVLGVVVMVALLDLKLLAPRAARP